MVNHCCYCNIIYSDSPKVLNHGESVHSTSTKCTQGDNADIEGYTGYKQTETAFTGSIQTYLLERRLTAIDLQQLFGQEENQIQILVISTRDGPEKVQLAKELKPKLDQTPQ